MSMNFILFSLLSKLKDDDNSSHLIEKKKYEYINVDKTKEEKIFQEKRRRNQIYKLLDYVVSNSTFFDFVSSDTFEIVSLSKIIGSILLSPSSSNITSLSSEKYIGSEFFLFSFLYLDLPIKTILQQYNFHENEIGNIISNLNQLNSKSIFEKKDFYIRKIWRNTSIKDIKLLHFSHEVNLIFEKCAENALSRFKTPVITPEIFFITLMEENNNNTSKTAKLIQKILKEKVNWYLLRYKLIKTIHAQESEIRNNLKKNEHYFAYLLKIYLSENEFNTLIEQNSLSTGISFFRNQLIFQLLSLNLIDIMSSEINQSIKQSPKRSYSF